MAKPRIARAVLFADISGSTRLYEKLGDTRALEFVGTCMKILRDAAEACKGRVVKTIGDELMCVFSTASAAARAAIDMQNRIGMQAPVDGQPLHIRVGLQFGPVVPEDDDVFGDCVNVAAHMAKLAKPGQIIAAGECVRAMSESLKAQTRAIDKLSVKGRGEQVEVYELFWQESEDRTVLEARFEAAPERSTPTLRIRYRDKKFDLGPGRDVVRLGRDPSCDIVLSDRKASREHARIERRRDKFVLVDISSNGTFLTFNGAREMPLKREEAVLHGRGAISFGHPYAGDPEEILSFDIELTW